MLTNLDHLTIAVADVAVATETYERLLGRPPLWRGSHPEGGTAASLFALGNGVIELLGPSPSADASESEGFRSLLSTRGEGLLTLSFGTADATAAALLLRERGVRATAPQDGEALGSDGSARRYRLVELSPRATRALPVSLVERPAPLALSKPHAPDAASFGALDHVVVRSADLEAARALYGSALGIRLALDTALAGQRMLFFRLAGVTLEVVEDASVGAADVLHGLAYRVGDLPAARRRLEASGFPVSDLRAGNKPGTEVFTVRGSTHGVPTLVLRDPARDERAAGRP
jgi:catechol 2,3-dioxygenase-like lactoylglutathione lyase family enzyme